MTAEELDRYEKRARELAATGFPDLLALVTEVRRLRAQLAELEQAERWRDEAMQGRG